MNQKCMGTACDNVHMIWAIFKRTFQTWTAKVGPLKWVYRIFFICKFAWRVIFLLFISYGACQRVLLPDKSLVDFAPGPHWWHSPRPPYIGYRSAITIFGPLNQIPATTTYLIMCQSFCWVPSWNNLLHFWTYIRGVWGYWPNAL